MSKGEVRASRAAAKELAAAAEAAEREAGSDAATTEAIEARRLTDLAECEADIDEERADAASAAAEEVR